MMISQNLNPKVFISYAWEDNDTKDWVKNLGILLRNNGVNATIDRWEIAPGDRLPLFMEKSVRENDYVLIICTPTYKKKSDNRIGGVGYEGDIMTAEVLSESNNRKFIPILKSGNKKTSIPLWLSGKYFIDLSTDSNFALNIDDLITTLFNSRELPPKVGQIPNRFQNPLGTVSEIHLPESRTEIRIKGILVDEVTSPRNDGTSGSGLYKIPFELSDHPSSDWSNLFIKHFNHPPEYGSMHRPGIASVIGNKIFLDGTTIDEVEKHHKKTLKIAVEMANKEYQSVLLRRKHQVEQKRLQEEQHRNNIEATAKRLRFDD